MIKLFEEFTTGPDSITKEDPYCEEIWNDKLNEKVKQDYNQKIDYEIEYSILVQSLENKSNDPPWPKMWTKRSWPDMMLEHLNEKFTGWLIFDQKSDFILHAKNWEDVGTVIIDEAYYNDKYYLFHKPQKYYVNFNPLSPPYNVENQIHKVNIKEFKYNPSDPYNEEIWENNSLNESFNGGEIHTLHHGSFIVNGEPTLRGWRGRYRNRRDGKYFIDIPISNEKSKPPLVKGNDPYDEEIWDDDEPLWKRNFTIYDNLIIIISSNSVFRHANSNHIKYLEYIIGDKEKNSYGEVEIKNLNYIYQICQDLGFKQN